MSGVLHAVFYLRRGFFLLFFLLFFCFFCFFYYFLLPSFKLSSSSIPILLNTTAADRRSPSELGVSLEGVLTIGNECTLY